MIECKVKCNVELPKRSIENLEKFFSELLTKDPDRFSDIVSNNDDIKECESNEEVEKVYA